MDKKYLLIGGIALFAAWWFFFRKKEEEEKDPTIADDQPEGNEEAEEEESTTNTNTGTTGNYAPRNRRGNGITATPRTPVNRTGTGNRSNTGRGNGRITVEPIKTYIEPKIVTVLRNE